MLHGLPTARHPQPPSSPQPHQHQHQQHPQQPQPQLHPQARSVTPSAAASRSNQTPSPVKPPVSAFARPTTPLSHDRPRTAQSTANVPAVPSTPHAPPISDAPDAYGDRWPQSTSSPPKSPTGSDSQRRQQQQQQPDEKSHDYVNTEMKADNPNINGDSASTMNAPARTGTAEGAPTLPAVSDLSGNAASQPLHFDFNPRPPATTGPVARKPAPSEVAANHHQTPAQNGESSRPETDATARPESRRSGRERKRQGPSQKTMLSRALQKANTAVLLDNATNYEGAIEAYVDACVLLQQVMQRTGGGDERQKLEEIRKTYNTRIIELRRLGVDAQADGKALPERPLSGESSTGSMFSPNRETGDNDDMDDEGDDQDHDDDDDDVYEVGTATSARVLDTSSSHKPPPQSKARRLAPGQIPPRRQSLKPSTGDDKIHFANSVPFNPDHQEHPHSKSSQSRPHRNKPSSPPPPPSPHPGVPVEIPSSHETPRSSSPASSEGSPSPPEEHNPQQQRQQQQQLLQAVSNESTSWLDTIDESAPSSNSSSHSRSSSLYLRRKQNRPGSGATEAEFDAALDAAVEAAYNQGFEPATNSDEEDYRDMNYGTTSAAAGRVSSNTNRSNNTPFVGDDDDDVVSNARRNVELAKQKVREAQLEAEAASAREREKRRIHEEAAHGNFAALDSHYDDDEAEEEERILEEMMDDFDFDMQSKSALPRKSGSSSVSGRTGGSSVGSNFTTAGTSLSTLAEEDVLPPTSAAHESNNNKQIPIPPASFPQKPPAPPTSAPPPPPIPSSYAPPFTSHPTPTPTSPPPQGFSPTGSSGPSVRARRLSGQTPKELVIETGSRPPPGTEAPQTVPPSMPEGMHHPFPQDEPPKTSIPESWQTAEREPVKPETPVMGLERPAHGPSDSADSLPLRSPATPALLTRTISQDRDIDKPLPPTTTTHAVPMPPGANKGAGPMRVSIPTEARGHSPATPATGSFPHPGMSRAPHSFAATYPQHTAAHIFDNDIHSPTAPGSPNAAIPDAPLPLEPCPQSFLLRPFWLMRCLYQTIAHPRGGYLTTKLFVPREVWRVKNVKVKAIEEKISNCDLLTAALLKLANVDMYDAEAVLEEMQSLETVLDQVQTLLSKKLGNEVGVQGSMSLFKTPSNEDTSPLNEQPGPAKTSSGSGGKSYLSSWRKLRSKSSGTGNSHNSNSSGPPTAPGNDGNRDTMTLGSLPMTEAPNSQVQRNVMDLQFVGPHANYMSALARLFDAAQVIDQIARQVEDPGLRHSSQTLVGLELSTRHAAEFFGFYVCRFILNDVRLMMDKFIKRGTEWVLA